MAKKELLTLSVQERQAKGKGPNRRLRTQGLVPGIYYDKNGANIMVQVKELPLTKAYSKLGGSQVFNMEIERDGKTEALPALVWRVKYEPVRGTPQHVDFLGVDMNEEIKVTVRIVLTGKAKGITLGGTLSQYRETVELIAKPLDIPEHIELDVTELGINDNIMIEDIEFPEGTTPVFDENYAIAGVSIRGADDEEEDELLEGEEAAEGTEPEAEEE